LGLSGRGREVLAKTFRTFVDVLVRELAENERRREVESEVRGLKVVQEHVGLSKLT